MEEFKREHNHVESALKQCMPVAQLPERLREENGKFKAGLGK